VEIQGDNTGRHFVPLNMSSHSSLYPLEEIIEFLEGVARCILLLLSEFIECQEEGRVVFHEESKILSPYYIALEGTQLL
jgi:hypothetical protein